MHHQKAKRLLIIYADILDAEQAQALVDAGFDRPSRIITAKQSELEKVPGIDKKTAKKLKGKFKPKD